MDIPSWRLIIDELPRSGAANMAVDQAIAEACAAGESATTLRFYRWQPPAVTLGRHQKISDIDMAAVEAHGYEVVRRPTGGRAILHTDELTYSVAGSDADPILSGGVMDAYLRLSNALLAGLAQTGVAAVDKAGGHVRAGPDVSAACFEIPSAYEITVGSQKLMGSAQSRRAGYVLQHGSLPLVGDITRLVEMLAIDEQERGKLRLELGQRACTLAQALGVAESDRRVQFEQVAQHLIRGFEQELGITLRAGALLATELRRAAVLIRTQFGNAEWTSNRKNSI